MKQGIEALRTDVDLRLTTVWMAIWNEQELCEMLQDEAERELLAGMVRAAYSQGYYDALCEDAEGKRGILMKNHGYRVP